VLMCSVFISEQTATSAPHNVKLLVFITEMESVYSAVRTESFQYRKTAFIYRAMNLVTNFYKNNTHQKKTQT